MLLGCIRHNTPLRGLYCVGIDTKTSAPTFCVDIYIYSTEGLSCCICRGNVVQNEEGGGIIPYLRDQRLSGDEFISLKIQDKTICSHVSMGHVTKMETYKNNCSC